jgi:hypothetical protein
MKKYIAKFLQWCLYRLGYTETYVRRNTVEINVTTNADEALKKLQKLTHEAERLVELNEKLGIK